MLRHYRIIGTPTSQCMSITLTKRIGDEYVRTINYAQDTYVEEEQNTLLQKVRHVFAV
jgi:hypothetical protein